MAKATIYTREFCGYCARAVRLLKDKGVDFEQIDAGMDAAKRKEMIQRANGRSTFPQIFIGQTHVGGSDELHQLESDGRLDALLKGGAS